MFRWRKKQVVLNWMVVVFEWIIQSRKELTHQHQECIWANLHSKFLYKTDKNVIHLKRHYPRPVWTPKKASCFYLLVFFKSFVKKIQKYAVFLLRFRNRRDEHSGGGRRDRDRDYDRRDRYDRDQYSRSRSRSPRKLSKMPREVSKHLKVICFPNFSLW